MEAERAFSSAELDYWPDEAGETETPSTRTAGTTLLAVAPPVAAVEERPATTTQSGFYSRYGKRTLDVVLSAAILVMAAPVIFLLAIAVLVTSGRPIFHRSRRVGLNGRDFTMWKLRTMVPNAEQVLEQWKVSNPDLAAAYFTDYKLPNDPRITPLGRFLRKSSLDELPQLWNALRGDMSLVGPRPIVRDELRNYGAHVGDFLSVRPGITGMWQTDGRNEIRYPERSWFELTYCRTHTLGMDLRILVKTLASPLRFDG